VSDKKLRENDYATFSNFYKHKTKSSTTYFTLMGSSGGNLQQGRRQKIFQGGGQKEKRPKISKKYRKIALLSL